MTPKPSEPSDSPEPTEPPAEDSPGTQAGGRRGLVRLLRLSPWIAALVVAVSLPWLFAFATEKTLQSSFGERLVNRRPDRFQMSWRSVASPSPGRLRFESVTLRGQTPRTGWQIEAEELEAQVSLAALLGRIFECEWIRGRGVSFAMLRLEGGRPALAEGAPPIDLPAAGRALQSSAREQSGWTIDLDGIAVEDLRRIWIDRERLDTSPDATFGGAMRFALRRHVEIEAARLELHAAALSEAGEEVLREIDGSVEIDLAPMRPREVDFEELLRALSGHAEFTADISSLGALRRSFETLRWLDLDASGSLVVDLGLDRGTVRPGSHLAVESPSVRALLFDQQIVGAGTIAGRFEQSSAGGSAESTNPVRVDIELQRFAGGPRPPSEPGRLPAADADSGGRSAFEGGGLTASLTGTWPRLSRVPQLATGTLHLEDARLNDVSALQRYLPAGSGVVLRSGTADLGVDLRFEGHRGSGSATLQGSAIRFRLQEVAMRGDLALDLQLPEVDLDSATLRVNGSSLRVDGLQVEGSTRTADWWSRARASRGTLRFRDSGPAFAAHFEGEMRDSRPLVAYYLKKRRLLRPLEELLTVEGLRIRGDLDVGAQRGRVECFAAEAENLEIQADLTLGRGRPEGIALFEYRRFALGLEAEASERDWKLRRPRRWFESRRQDRCPA
ncbi:MAG: hypothetical protein DWQ30_18685 [Acidobacteria bacterium]|nr:MAG: hypothetical protein DWQ30_18685 [Acidobacteriota bacterium]